MITVRRVVGRSMEPTYKNGQIILLTPIKTPQVGDVVMAVVNKREVLKRIVAISNGHMVQLRGDNAAESTEYDPVTMNAVLGVVVWPKRQLK